MTGTYAGRTPAVADARAPRQDRSRATRARLLEAAIDCLAELGWAASTVATIAERAGVSRGAAQHHFPTREALFTAAVEQVTLARADELRARLAASTTTVAVVDVVFELFSGKLFRAALTMWVAAASDPEMKALIVPVEARIGREVHRLVVSTLGVDEKRAGVRETVQATLDLARGLGVANLLTDDTARRRRITKQWAALLDETLVPDRR
jgi:AcrR family transcriptional regulator